MPMQRYPYLARYNNTSQYNGVVLWMQEPHRGVILYIPTPTVDPYKELDYMETMSPAHSEIDDYSGSVVLRTSTTPTLGA